MALQGEFERHVGDIRICVLGPLTVEHDGRELHVAGSHRRRLLAFPASRAGQAATAEAIAEALCGEHPPPTVTKSIQNHVARLRGSFAGLDGELIETTPHGPHRGVVGEHRDAVNLGRCRAIACAAAGEQGLRSLSPGPTAVSRSRCKGLPLSAVKRRNRGMS